MDYQRPALGNATRTQRGNGTEKGITQMHARKLAVLLATAGAIAALSPAAASAWAPADTAPIEIRRAAVIGAGTMGGGITMNYANAGIPVIVKETTQEALDRGMAIIRKNYANSVKKGKLSQAAMDELGGGARGS